LIQTELQAQWANYRALHTSENIPPWLVAPVSTSYCFHWHRFDLNVPVVELEKIDGTLYDLLFQPSPNSEAWLFDAVDQIACLREHCARARIRFNHRDSHPHNIYFKKVDSDLQFMFGDLGMSCVVSGTATLTYQQVYAYTRDKVRSCDNSVHDLRILLFSLYEYFCNYPSLGLTYPEFDAWLQFYFTNNFFNTSFGQDFWDKNGAVFNDPQTWFFHQAYDDLIDLEGENWKCFLPQAILTGLRAWGKNKNKGHGT
tara:strand:+ start:713 stop:1480 length:768 start_codon:yes stop_codon:yes gene_type:complete